MKKTVLTFTLTLFVLFSVTVSASPLGDKIHAEMRDLRLIQHGMIHIPIALAKVDRLLGQNKLRTEQDAFHEKLRDDRWKQRKFQILQRAAWKKTRLEKRVARLKKRAAWLAKRVKKHGEELALKKAKTLAKKAS